MVDSDGEDWIPLRQAVVEVAKAYSAFMLCEPAGALEDAHNAIIRQVEWLQAKSRATTWVVNYQASETWEGHRLDKTSHGEEILPEFWAHYNSASTVFVRDWVNGEFRFLRKDDDQEEGFDVFCFALGVEVTRKGLPLIGEQDINTASFDRASRQMLERVKGRKPANWWPDFAEELAVYLHEHGLPETQETLISGVQSAMTAGGKNEPSRSQIQPVIRAVFSRLARDGI